MLGVQLGVDDAPEDAADVVGRRRGAGHRLVDGRTGIVGVRDGRDGIMSQLIQARP